MKKLLLSLSLIGMFWGLATIASASTTNCKDVEFSNGVTACVNIEQSSTNTRRLDTSIDGWSTANLRCDIMTPDSALKSVGSCNGTFYYNKSDAGRIKLWIRYNETAPRSREGKPNSNSERTYPQWVYDFDNEERADDNLDSSSSNGDLDNFYLTTDDTTPSTSQYVDLTIKARDSDDYTITDYTDSVNFKVYYRSSSSSSWTQTTSSTYYTMSSSYTDGYDFTSSNNGVKTISNFIKFNKNNYDYKVRVYDENDTSIYNEITFNVGSSSNSSNGDLDNFYLTTDDTTPSTSQYVDLMIKARDSDDYTITDYTDSVNFKVYYRSSSSSSWTQTTSSTYYTMSSSYTDGYDFTSSNNGVKTISNFIKFNKNNYDYKVRVYDENDTSIYNEITFNVGSSSNSSSNVDWFTSSELATVENIYDKRDNMISNLEDSYSKLRNSTRRNTMSDDLKTAMQEIIDDESSKTYDNFDDFNTAWLVWYRYTISIR